MDAEIKEGDLVVVVGKLDNRINDIAIDVLVVGTFIGHCTEKRVQVLLSNGSIFTGYKYDITSLDNQGE